MAEALNYDHPLAFAAEASKFKWAMHVLGPDEYIAMPDYPTAVEQSALMNAALNRRVRDENDPPIFAYPAGWPGSWDEHAATLVKQAEEEARDKAAHERRLAKERSGT